MEQCVDNYRYFLTHWNNLLTTTAKLHYGTMCGHAKLHYGTICQQLLLNSTMEQSVETYCQITPLNNVLTTTAKLHHGTMC